MNNPPAILSVATTIISSCILGQKAPLAANQSQWIGISAPLSVLEARERERPGRIIGSARAQAAIVHKDVTYDLEFDTSKSSTSEIVTAIKTKLDAIKER